MRYQSFNYLTLNEPLPYDEGVKGVGLIIKLV